MGEEMRGDMGGDERGDMRGDGRGDIGYRIKEGGICKAAFLGRPSVSFRL